MNYTGCLGNKNRFMTKQECDNSCKHEAVRVQSQITCSLPKVVGQCLANEDGPKAFAKWYFDRTNKVCQPFYFSGCGGNENNFGFFLMRCCFQVLIEGKHLHNFFSFLFFSFLLC